MARLDNRGMIVVNRTGKSAWYGYAGWSHPVLIRDVRLPDGHFGTAYLGQEADTYFSWPARAKVGGRWFRGFVSGNEHNSPECMQFFPDADSDIRMVIGGHHAGHIDNHAVNLIRYTDHLWHAFVDGSSVAIKPTLADARYAALARIRGWES